MNFLAQAQMLYYMKEVCEPYMENLQTYTSNSFTGFAESDTKQEMEISPDEMFRSAGYSFNQAKKGHAHIAALPVNNYLKTTEEIEVEFLFMMSCYRTTPHEKENPCETYGKIVKKHAESFLTIYSPDMILPGPMEENY